MITPYTDRQEAIYAQFREATTSLRELKPDPCITRPSAGYIIAFRHAESIMGPYAQFTASLQNAIPCLRYDVNNGHTTITVAKQQPLSHFQPDEAILHSLCQTVSLINKTLWQQVRIDFRDWLFNAETLIVAGMPNDAFWEVGVQVQSIGAQHGLELRMPWGSHMTAGRFTAPCGGSTVNVLRERLQTAPLLGISTPTSIHVGHYTTTESAFTFHTAQAFL